MKSFLFEIGSEEIPARFISSGLALLKQSFVQLLNNSLIDYGNISEYATPRRLTIFIENVSERQKDRTIESLGPPKKVAFDASGAPTKAALGFAKSMNMDVKDLTVKKTDRGEYLVARIEEKGKETINVLAEAIPKLISSLQLPRSMRWGDGSLRFFRPIRWILALFGNKIVPFEIDGIKSSNISYGHRFLSPAPIKIAAPLSYLSLLQKNYVIADIAERKRLILQGIAEIEETANCKVRKDEELLDIVTNLVEYPTAVFGSFDNKYLALPKELLITVMKSHQKYFSVEDQDGNMLPAFVVISNTSAENNDTVRKGAERVLRARLEDARFYYLEDQKKTLRDYLDDLKKVTFQEKLGSLYEKTNRITSLCSFIADKIGLQKEKLIRASTLCKADLVTGVVGEFPELQGYMGMIYASNSGEDKEVAEAIYEHYLPKFAGDTLPSGEIGAIVSLADKIDNIVSFFYVGLIPSGSEDPFALRRQASGIINILQNKNYPMALNTLIDRALENLQPSTEEKKDLFGKILHFFSQRLENILLSRGYSHDIINAVLSAQELDITTVINKVEILSEFKKRTDFAGLLTAAKRVYNILVKYSPGKINEKLFTETAEKDLFQTLCKVNDKLTSRNFNALFELEKPINTFFDNVLVMDKDPRIKDNRLALLFSVKKTFDTLGDFSKIIE
jgi:glycyl-tRNA synthetase beta chain